VTTVRIKKPPLWKVTATVKLTSGEILVASASVRAKTIMEAMDSDPLWESMADDALDNDRIKALLEDDPAQVVGLIISAERA
jgi:uridine phosphorylase